VSSRRKPEVSIVIPAYNEAGRLPQSLARIYAHLQRAPYLAEVIVVDDGSTDETAHCVARLASHYPGLVLLRNPSNRGKGSSVKRGVLESRGDYVLFTDADLSTPIAEFDRFLPLLREGWDVVLGSRALDPRLLERRQPWLRHQAGQLFHWLVRELAGLPFRDTQCGFKAFRRAAALELFRRQRVERFGFDVELLWLAEHLRLRCREVGVRWLDDAASRVRLARDGPEMLLELLQLCWRRWRGSQGVGELALHHVARS
jgi:glycosyltransferase involved in cell wall biosynthesis